MSKLAKVIDDSALVRDMDSKAILNTDKNALVNHRRNMRTMQTMVNQTERIDSLQNDINEIKQLLSLLLNKNSGN